MVDRTERATTQKQVRHNYMCLGYMWLVFVCVVLGVALGNLGSIINHAQRLRTVETRLETIENRNH